MRTIIYCLALIIFATNANAIDTSVFDFTQSPAPFVPMMKFDGSDTSGKMFSGHSWVVNHEYGAFCFQYKDENYTGTYDPSSNDLHLEVKVENTKNDQSYIVDVRRVKTLLGWMIPQNFTVYDSDMPNHIIAQGHFSSQITMINPMEINDLCGWPDVPMKG